MQEASLRGAPGNAVGSIQSTITQPYDAMMANLQSGQANFQADQAARSGRLADYNTAVLGARDLIGQQMAQAVAPISAKSAADVANINAQSAAKVADLGGQAQLALLQLQAKQQAASAKSAAAANKGSTLTGTALAQQITDAINASNPMGAMTAAADPAQGISQGADIGSISRGANLAGQSAAQYNADVASGKIKPTAAPPAPDLGAAQQAAIAALNKITPTRSAANQAALQQQYPTGAGMFGQPVSRIAAPTNPNNTPANQSAAAAALQRLTGTLFGNLPAFMRQQPVAATPVNPQQAGAASLAQGLANAPTGTVAPSIVQAGTQAQLPVAPLERAQANLTSPDWYQSLAAPVISALGQQGFTATPAAQSTGIANAIQKLISAGTSTVAKQQTAATKATTAADKTSQANVAAQFAQQYGGADMGKVATAAKMTPLAVANLMLDPDPTNSARIQGYYNSYEDAINKGQLTTTKLATDWLNKNVSDINVRNVLKAMKLR
jgi:hypothetical protein